MEMEGQNGVVTEIVNKGDADYANPQDFREIFDLFEHDLLAITDPTMDLVTKITDLNAEDEEREQSNRSGGTSYASMTQVDISTFCGNPEGFYVQVPVPTPEAHVPVSVKRSSRKSRVQNRNAPDPVEDNPVVKTKTPKTRSGTKRNVSICSEEDAPGSLTPKGKKPKLHESDDPVAKNARAAKLNREKKKEEMEKLKMNNSILTKDLNQKAIDLKLAVEKIEELKNEVNILKNKNRAVIGLNRISQSTKDLLDSVKPILVENFGITKVTCAPWFDQVTTVTPDADAVTEAPTSSYITVHISVDDKSMLLDYSPDEPCLSDEIPE